MALTGVNVTAAYAGFAGFNRSAQTLITSAVWSENLTDPGVSTKIAPGSTMATGRPIFRFRAAVDAWVSVGPIPDASTGIRYFVPADTDYDVAVNPGDTWAWIAA